ncbi:MAG TPA: hypothetical protein VLA04_05025 [Verrucomicrobiae bacterium]|nr:hypothetical protein [Verrucomicrobiae bacterium]
MQEAFRHHLQKVNELAARELDATDPDEKEVVEEDVDRALAEHALARIADLDSQYDIFEIQKEKQEIMRQMRAALHDVDNPDVGPYETARDAITVVYNEDNDCYAVKTPKGEELLTEGEILANMEWGFRYALGSDAPRSIRKRYIIEDSKQQLRQCLDQQIHLDEQSSARVDRLKKKAYRNLMEDREKSQEPPGVIAEKVIATFFNRLQHDSKLKFSFEQGDIYQDVTQKIDFIIKKNAHIRGVHTEEEVDDTLPMASGIQFTLKQDADDLSHKQGQIDYSLREGGAKNEVSDIMLVSLSPKAQKGLFNAYNQFKEQKTHSVDRFIPKHIQEELFTHLLKGIFSPQQIAEQWQAINAKTPSKAVEEPVAVPEEVAPEPVPTEEVEAIPETFEQAAAYLRQKNLGLMEQNAREQGLYFHDKGHALDVERRATAIIRAVYGAEKGDKQAMNKDLALASLIAAVHDKDQVFSEVEEGRGRHRAPGVSELKTMRSFIGQMTEVNQEAGKELISGDDEDIVTDAMECTIVSYNKEEGVHQKHLTPETGLVPRAIALADLGGLGMEGPYSFFEGGSKLFLEHNPDIFRKIWNTKEKMYNLHGLDERQEEDIVARLRQFIDSQENFAVTRFARFETELEGLSPEAKRAVKELFKGFEDAVEEVKYVAEEQRGMGLSELLEAFNFAEYLPAYQSAL